MLIRCPACRGTKRVMGLGFIIVTCKTCHGVGEIDDIESQERNDGEQNHIESSQDTKRKENVDTGTQNNGKRGRKVRGEFSTVGISAEDLQERKESREGSKTIGRDEGEGK